MLTAFVLALFALAVSLAFADSYKRTGFVPPPRALGQLPRGTWASRLRSAFGGTFYTYLAANGITNLTTTFTHSLNIPGASLVARIIMKGNVGATQTAALQIVGLSTNTVTVAPMLACTLMTFDLEVQQIHSINL